MATVVLVGTLDTKAIEYQFAKECIEGIGVKTHVIDIGILADPPFRPDTPAAEVAKAAGTDLEKIRFGREGSDTRAVAVQTMERGLSVCLNRLAAEGKCDAVLGMGGSGGSNIISAAMRSLPLGLPKLLVSTMMSGDVRPYVGGTDITMMYSVTDIAGLNRFSRLIFANAAFAAAGMAQNHARAVKLAQGEKKPLVAVTMFGITTPGVLRIRANLERSGFETIVFHATGAGGMAMEEMIRAGFIDGVIDYTLAELCSHEFGGAFSAGETRLTAASEAGIPQVVVPGAIEVLNYNGVAHLPPEKNIPERKLIVHNETVCAVKANNEELAVLGRIVGTRLSKAKGPTEIMLPVKGLDLYESPNGGPWYDENSTRVLFDSIYSSMTNPNIPITELANNINDSDFADAVSQKFIDLWTRYDKKPVCSVNPV